MRMQSFHLSTQGASHIKKNKECQDASESYYDERCAIAIVCDGHGGDDYVRSASGSAFACTAAKTSILNFIENVNRDELTRHHKQLIHNLKASIISAWNEAVYEHYEANPFTEAEIAVLSDRAKRKYLQEKRIESAYGTTLIAVACTKDYWFGIHIGDGKCVAVNPEGKFVQPIPWDEKCFLNATTSICDTDALNRFRSFYSEKLPVAVFVGSDGIDDCFSTEQQLNNLYKTVLYSFATSDFDAAVNDLSDYLPRLSAKGSGDDVSVAAVLDLDMIGEISVVKEFDKEKEKARVEENARIAAQKAEEERQRVEAERAEQLRQQQAKKAATVKRCSHCGAKLVPGMKFCGECGNRIVPDNSGTTQVSTQPDPNLTPEELKIIKIVPFGSDSSIVPNDSEQKTDENAATVIVENENADEVATPPADVQEDDLAASEDDLTVSEEVIIEEHEEAKGEVCEEIEPVEAVASDDVHSEAEFVSQEDTSASGSNMQSQTDI